MTTPTKPTTPSPQAVNARVAQGQVAQGPVAQDQVENVQTTTVEDSNRGSIDTRATSNANVLRIGTLLPTRELAITGTHNPATTITLARQLEHEGVDSLWIGESVTARPRLDTYTMLAAVCTATTSATIGTAVLLPSLRNPVSFAHQVASLDQLAEGRLVLGLGAGFPGEATKAEFTSLGADYRRRVSGIEATIQAARSIWSGAAEGLPATDPTGRYGFQNVAVTPPTARLAGPQTWLATGTPAGLERCGAFHDGWLPYPTEPASYSEGLATVRAAATAAGRNPDRITPALYVTVSIGEDAQQKVDEYCMAYYGGPSELVGLIQAMIAGSLDAVVERIAQYIEAGARHIVIRHATLRPEEIAVQAPRLHAALRGIASL